MQHHYPHRILLLIIICYASPVSAQIALERVKITREISMKVPDGFIPMSEADLIRKYVSARKPLAMYTSDDRLIDLGINETSSNWSSEDLNILKEFYKANILNLFTKVKFIQEDIRKIGEQAFVVFEFVSVVSDEESTFGGTNATSNYTYIQYTVRDDKVLLFNFTCPARMQTQWQDAVKEMMESVRIQ